MKIEINDNSRMLTALEKVSEGRYFDALCLFARVDGYESMLNQIACLCHLNDVGYAVELYRRFLAQYYFTHNCYNDLSKMSEHTVDTLAFFDSALDVEVFDGRKVSANVELLGEFESGDYCDEDDYYEEYDDVPESNFCEAGSADNFFRIIKRLQEETDKGHLKKSQKLIEQLLEFDSDDESVLEGQMLLCLAEHDYEQGAKFAERFAKLNQFETYRSVAVAVMLLSGSDKHRKSLNKMLERLMDFADEITDSDLMEYVEIAESTLENDDLTGRLAKILYERSKVVGCEALRVCSRIFCNMGWKKLAHDAVLALINAVPWDSYAQVLLMYVNSGINVKLDKFFSNLTLMRHLDVPSQLAVIAEYQLIERMEAGINNGADCVFVAEDYKLLHCITNVCKTHVYRGNSEKFVNEATVLSAVLEAFEPQNKEEFFTFAKQQLCSFLPEPPVQKDILLRLVKLGFNGKLLITADNSYYSLDLSKLTVDDRIFLEAFCLCAALKKVDVRRLQRNYLKIKEVAAARQMLEGEFGYDLVHRLAYCLLAVSYKDFTHSSIADYFSEGEDELYRIVQTAKE